MDKQYKSAVNIKNTRHWPVSETPIMNRHYYATHCTYFNYNTI